MVPSIEDTRKIGLGFCLCGAMCFVLAIPLFLDRTLLVLSNLSSIAGVGLLLGPIKTISFFFRGGKLIPSSILFGGFMLIILGYSFIGFSLEMYAIWKLFAAFLPNIFQALSLMPGMEYVLRLPGIRTVKEYAYDQRRLPV